MRLADFDALTFDCYGTLIDWESGIVTALQSLLARVTQPPTRDAVLESFARHETRLEKANPQMLYRELLTQVHDALADDWGVATNAAESRRFGGSVGDWPAFDDTQAALRYLQLDEALAILFSTPFLVALLCGPLLGEWVGWRRWTAISVGFLGVLLVARPGFAGLHPAALLSLGSAVCYSLYVISTRVLARSDSSETTLFYSNLVGAVAMLPVIPFVWTPPDNAFVMALMVLVGALGSGGHYLLIRGHRLAPASTLAPFIYTQMVWTTTLGFLVFGDVPHRWTIVGGLVVVSSGLYLLYRERQIGKSTTSEAAIEGPLQ